MIKRVMIRLCGYLFGLSVCVLHILLCYLLLGWVTTLVVMGGAVADCSRIHLHKDTCS